MDGRGRCSPAPAVYPRPAGATAQRRRRGGGGRPRAGRGGRTGGLDAVAPGTGGRAPEQASGGAASLGGQRKAGCRRVGEGRHPERAGRTRRRGVGAGPVAGGGARGGRASGCRRAADVRPGRRHSCRTDRSTPAGPSPGPRPCWSPCRYWWTAERRPGMPRRRDGPWPSGWSRCWPTPRRAVPTGRCCVPDPVSAGGPARPRRGCARSWPRRHGPASRTGSRRRRWICCAVRTAMRPGRRTGGLRCPLRGVLPRTRGCHGPRRRAGELTARSGTV